MAREVFRDVKDTKRDFYRKFLTLVDYDGGTNPIYVGKAVTGTATSQPFWQIRKIAWDGNDNPTSVKWADSVTTFTKEWDDRTTYTYA